MKTTDQTSDRIISATAAGPRWTRVRPALRWTFALSVTTWLGIAGAAAGRSLASGELLESASRFIAQNASPMLNLLALASVAAVAVERARTTGGLRQVRRRLVRSVRTLRLIPSSRTARA